ncbi:TolC family protein [Aurantibacter sp.]|uniref:TolC family protein n=1 Tax=Aurantibacter sp. TaxID=2807103 RepID=UPI0035C87000
MTKHFILCALFISVSVIGQTNTPESLSLQEAIDYALKSNRTAINSAHDVDAAIQQKKETIRGGFPQISGQIDYINNIRQQFDPVDFNGDGIPEFGAQHQMNASASLNQMIFDGSYIVGLQSAKVFLQISKNAKTKTDLQVREAVINAYGNVLLAEESLKILNSNIGVLEKNVFDITKIFENGFEEEESVEQLKITLSGVKNNLNKTKRLQKIAYQMLNLNLGIELDQKILLTDNLKSLTEKNIFIEALTLDDVKNTIDFKIAENDKVSKELLVKLERSRNLPTIGAFLNGGYLANRETFDFSNSDKKWIGTSSFGASIKIPLFSSGQHGARTQRAKINLEKAELNVTETEQRIKLQLASAKSDYEFAVEDFKNKTENLTLAKRIEAKNQTKFFEGVSTSFDLRQAQTQLYSSQQDYLQAMLNVLNAKAKLDTITNQTTTF